MIEIKYKNKILSYDSDKNEVYIDGVLDRSKQYSPSFVDNKDNTVTFIGLTNNKSNEFISLSGKVINTIMPDDIKL